MSVTMDQLQALLQSQQRQFELGQMKLIEMLAEKFSIQRVEPQKFEQEESPAITLLKNIPEFFFDPISGVTFESWFNKHEDVFRVDLADREDSWKVRQLVRKLGVAEHERYVNYILPDKPGDKTFQETVRILSTIFGDQSSLFSIRYNCLNVTKSSAEDWVTYAGKVNKECERFQLRRMTEDQFKCLIFACGLKSPQDTDVRTRILNKIEQDQDVTLQAITAECQRLTNLKHDTALIQKKDRDVTVCAVSQKTRETTTVRQHVRPKPPSACWKCGDWHFVRFCPFRRHRCSKCSRIGHKEDRCYGMKKRMSAVSRFSRVKTRRYPIANTVLATSQGKRASQRKYVSIKINGKSVRLQFDTASDITIISRSTWNKLGRPAKRCSHQVARCASGKLLKICGEFDCSVDFDGTSVTATCHVSEHASLDLLGLDWMEKLQLLDKPINVICRNITSYKVEPINQSLTEVIRKQHAKVFEKAFVSQDQQTSLMPTIRRGSRKRNPVMPLQVNPKKRTYDSSRGEVLGRARPAQAIDTRATRTRRPRNGSIRSTAGTSMAQSDSTCRSRAGSCVRGLRTRSIQPIRKPAEERQSSVVARQVNLTGSMQPIRKPAEEKSPNMVNGRVNRTGRPA